MAFQSNPYDPCLVNKEIDGMQMTITWHIYDLKVMHWNPRRTDEKAEN